MGSAERRARERENLRRAILDAARELFATQDYKNVSMRKIADRIEYSPTAIYLHFKDKDEILAHLIEEGFVKLCEMVYQAGGGDGTADPVERLRRGGRAYLAFAFENPHYYRLMFQLEDAGKALHDKAGEAAYRAFGFIRECVGAGQEAGRFRRDVEEIVLSHAVWAGIHGAAALVLSGHVPGMLPEAMRDAFLEQAVEMTLRGSTATPA
jgi:AcrR family transcriptional regulator